MMEQIGIDEVHRRVLSIAKEFDKICTKHSIPYFMECGTMLGAIRHQGFIPWDDDMDFGVPYEYYAELREILINELPYPYRCCDYRNHPAALDYFIKIEDQTTCINDQGIRLPLKDQLGVNIDIFPLNQCKRNDFHMKTIKFKRILLRGFFISKTQPDSMAYRVLKKMIRIIFLGNPQYIQNSIARSLRRIKWGKYTGMFFGYGNRNIVPTEWYGQGKRYQFEDTSFCGVEKYDEYLSQIYGDYMTPPPVEKRIPHVNNVYLRDN